MKFSKILIAVLCIMLFARADSANASMVWTGDYETGNLNQWGYHTPCLDTDSYNTGYKIADYPRYQILSGTGTRQGKYYVKYTAYPGDGCGAVSATDRIGVEHVGFATPSSHPDLYYGFSYKIDPNFKLLSGEWHSITSTNTIWENQNQGIIGGGNFQLGYQYNRIDFSHTNGAGSKIIYTLPGLNPVAVGVWHDFIYHIKYRKDTTGMIEIWHRKEGESGFTKILSLNTRTDFMPSEANNAACGSFPCDKLYVQETLYRGLTGGEVNTIQSVYYDNNHVATTYDEILSTFSGAVSPFPAHCYNSVKDGDETGIDCGGSCSACAAPSLDITPPAISIKCPPNSQTYNSNIISVSGDASDNSGVAKVELKVGSGGTYQKANGTASWNISGLSLAEGPNTIFAKVTDTSGITKETSITVTYNALVSPAPAASDPASLLFDGSFKSTDTWLGYGKPFGSWSFSTLIKSDTLVVSPSDRTPANYAGKITNRNGEFGSGETTVNRALLGSNNAANWPNNMELWSGFSIKLDPQWKFPAQGWELFWEVQQLFTLPDGSNHAYGPSLAVSFPNGNNPLKFMHTSVLGGATSQYTIASLTPGSWYDIMVHMKLTSDTSGFFYVYLRKPGETDYTTVLSKTGVNTLFSQDTSTQGAYRAYSGAGYYRGTSSESKSVYFENIKYGKTRASVEYGGSSSGNYPPACTSSDIIPPPFSEPPDFFLDTVPPIIEITAPADGQPFITKTIMFKGTASDDGGVVSKVQVKVNSGAWQPASGTSSWSKSVELTSLGLNRLYVNATDDSGNSRISSVNVMYSDTVLPLVEIASPGQLQVFLTPLITISGTASDNFALDKVQLKLGDGAWQNVPLTGVSWSKSITLIRGLNTIVMRANDTSGNFEKDAVDVLYKPASCGDGAWNPANEACDTQGNIGCSPPAPICKYCSSCVAAPPSPRPFASINASWVSSARVGGQIETVVNLENSFEEPNTYFLEFSSTTPELAYWSWFNGHRNDEQKMNTSITLGPKSSGSVAIITFGGAVKSGNLNIRAKSSNNGETMSLSKYVGILYGEDGIATETPEFGWAPYAIIALIGAFLLL